MLTVFPFDNDDRSMLVCEENGIKAGDLEFKQNGYVIDIISFSFFKNDESVSYAVFDALIRSLASFAFNHSCFYIYNSNLEIYDFCKKIGFIDKDGRQELVLSRIIHSNNH